MRVLTVVAVLILAACEDHTKLILGDDEWREDCTWIVTDSQPATITLDDLDRCIGNIKFVAVVGP